MLVNYVAHVYMWLIFLSNLGISAPKRTKHVHSVTEKTNGDSSRSIGFNKDGKKPTEKPVLKWRPSEDTKKALARQKGIPEDKIPANDPEFQFLWEDDYYDDYDFEHERNMIQHGTWEARRQYYHAAQLEEARNASKKDILA